MNLKNIDLIIFDFDGVLTDNFVYISSKGEELVRCSRADGLAFDALRKLKIETLILSSEANKVVTQRAKKLKCKIIQNVKDKTKIVTRYCNKYNISLSNTLFVGNDLNDLNAMLLCGYSACPFDSHPSIKKNASHILKSKGGFGIAREVVENLLQINLTDLLFKNDK